MRGGVEKPKDVPDKPGSATSNPDGPARLTEILARKPSGNQIGHRELLQRPDVASYRHAREPVREHTSCRGIVLA